MAIIIKEYDGFDLEKEVKKDMACGGKKKSTKKTTKKSPKKGC